MIVEVLLVLIIVVSVVTPLVLEYQKRRQDALFDVGSKVCFEWDGYGTLRGVVVSVLHRDYGHSPVFHVEFQVPLALSDTTYGTYLKSSVMAICPDGSCPDAPAS